MIENDQEKVILDAYFDKIFYINLQKDVTRNVHMLKQFDDFGIKNYERVEAIELNRMPNTSLFRNFNKFDVKYVLGQLSCRASHVLCMQMAKQRGYSKVLILEDDAYFLNDPNILLANSLDVLDNWDMLYFGGLIEPMFRNQIVCTHGYAIKNTLFDNVIFMAENSGMEIDNFYAKILQHMSYNHNLSGKYDIRIIEPFNQIVQDSNFSSNIQQR